MDIYTGIKLVLSSTTRQEIVLAWFDKEDIDLIKSYVSLLGYDDSIVKAD